MMEIKVLTILCFINVITNSVFANNNIGNLLQSSWQKPQSQATTTLSKQNNYVANELPVPIANSLEKAHAELKQAHKELQASENDVLNQFNEIQRLFMKQSKNSNQASPGSDISNQLKASNNNVFGSQSGSTKDAKAQSDNQPHSRRGRLNTVNPDISQRHTESQTRPRRQGMIRQQRSLHFSPTSQDLGISLLADIDQQFQSPMVPTEHHHFGFQESVAHDSSSNAHSATTSLTLNQPQISSNIELSQPIVSDTLPSQNVFTNSFDFLNENPRPNVQTPNNVGSTSGGSRDSLGHLINTHQTQQTSSQFLNSGGSTVKSHVQTAEDLIAQGNNILDEINSQMGEFQPQNQQSSALQQTQEPAVGVSWLQDAINKLKSNDEEDSSSTPMDYPLDQEIAQINTGASDAEGPFNSDMAYDAETDTMITEYDIAMTREGVRRKFPHGSVEPPSNGKRRRKRALLRDRSLIWPGGRIPYVIERKDFSSREERAVERVFREWEKYTCLNFTPARHTDRRAIHLKDSMGCHSFVGMKNMRRQTVGLKRACRKTKIMLHEIGHAIGMYHEQARPDRDRYLEIQYRNIPPPVRFNFDKINISETRNYSVPYDYLSIMHYGEKAFSTDKNGITMRTKNPLFQKAIGKAQRLSFRDIKSVNLMYNCADNCPRNIRCSHPEAFVGKNCKCWCPTRMNNRESAQLCPQPRRPRPNRWARPSPRPRPQRTSPRRFLPSHLQSRMTTPPTTSQGSSNTMVLTNELAELLRRRRLAMRTNPLNSNFYLFPPSLRQAIQRRLMQSRPPSSPHRSLLGK